MISNGYLHDIRGRLRITHGHTDAELASLIEAARMELILAGVSAEKTQNEGDHLIASAVTAFVKANYGFDTPEADMWRKAFENVKLKLIMAGAYRES